MRTKRPDRPPLELDDYSGEFQPDLHLSDFSKEGLMKLVEIGGSIYGHVNRQWYKAAIKRFGQKAADEMHHEVWFADGGAGDHENLELFGFRHGAARWNEKVRIDPEKLPPRASKDEPHCRWRIKLTQERVDYAADPGEYVRAHGLARETDAQIVNEEAGKYSQARRARSEP